MKLFIRELGSGEPIIILHGLYGSSDNWMSIARVLANSYRVILVDQRNHGRSPHSSNHSYSDLALDLLELFDSISIERAIIVGHSMGGKAGMLFAALNPNRVRGLVVVDILPFGGKEEGNSYYRLEREHRIMLTALQGLRLDIARTREELDSALAENIPVRSVRQFLLKSLKRNGDGTFFWQINIEGISQNITSLMGSILPSVGQVPMDTPTLFLKGKKSQYIHPKGIEALDSIFSNFKISIIPNAGHWLHAENPDHFLMELTNFLDELG